MVAKEMVEPQPQDGPATPVSHPQVQRTIDLDAHHFREIQAHQQLWNPRDRKDVRTIAALGQRYHEAITAIDLSACPPSFRDAYTAHINAWSNIAEALTASVSASPDRDALAKDVHRITKPLEATWAEVQSTARAAGVYVRN